MTPRNTAPFRADHVGSLLRTAPLKEARVKLARNEIDAAALKAVEDREIEKAIGIGRVAQKDGADRRLRQYASLVGDEGAEHGHVIKQNVNKPYAHSGARGGATIAR